MIKNRVLQPFQRFFRLEAASGVVLLGAALLALGWANSLYQDGYRVLWRQSLFGMNLHHWINDGLMAIFFFVVGLEIKREIVSGELSSRKKAMLPAAAALGGMIVPALIYSVINWGEPTIKGWGIPMATDIAFAIGVLSLLGNRVPASLKVFLTALAIVDDLGAVLVIALFYTDQIAWTYLLFGLGLLGALYVLSRRGFSVTAVYLAVGLIVWLTFLKSGVHATVTGVLLAVVIPSKIGEQLEHALHPWVSFLIMPIFALANAGVSIQSTSVIQPVGLGIIAGLVLGKQVGITLFSWLAVKLKLALLPDGVRWRQVYGVGWLGGIGFTMSLFIASLAFGEASAIDVAKLGIIIASVTAGVIGAWVIIAVNSTGRSKA